MKGDFSESVASITVLNRPTVNCPVTFSGFKQGSVVTVPKNILKPSNGFNRYSEFFEAVNYVLHYQFSASCLLAKVSEDLDSIQNLEEIDEEEGKKLKFISRQVKLLGTKRFDASDFCFAVGIYPRCRYEQLRNVLVLPNAKRVRSVISSTDAKVVLNNLFNKLSVYQKYCFLIVDEVQIKPTVAFSCGVMSGFSINDPNSKATSMLGIMMRCLHGGPSLMISIIPVSKLTASYQFSAVKETAQMVEDCGGMVIGSITDNHKINQHYCHHFIQKTSYEAVHPLDETRSWFLLFDTVHLLKCIRNNWITEKSKRLTFDGESIGDFGDVQALYKTEQGNILKCTPLTSSSVYPSRLQLQNVQLYSMWSR